jgi:hypothetical protein
MGTGATDVEGDVKPATIEAVEAPKSSQGSSEKDKIAEMAEEMVEKAAIKVAERGQVATDQ